MESVTFQCVFCKEEFMGYGNNPSPAYDVKSAKDRCCGDCDSTIVIPYRIKLMLNRRKTA